VRMARTTREDWIDAGLTLLREAGEHALTLERLCAAIGRTKGSFYHHFASMPELSRALLEAWEQRHTDVPIASSSGDADLGKRRKQLHATVKQLDWELDLTVRGWSLRDDAVREAVARVDARRIAYLESLLPRRISAARRRAIATLQYTAFLGGMQLDPTRTRGDEARSEALLYEVLGQLIDGKR
jgi:AcrR family transcriptional regulator